MSRKTETKRYLTLPGPDLVVFFVKQPLSITECKFISLLAAEIGPFEYIGSPVIISPYYHHTVLHSKTYNP